MRRAVQRDEDPGLPSPVHRRRGGWRRRDAKSASRRRRRRDLSRARPGARARPPPARDHGRDVRQGRRNQPRTRRLDAPVRRAAAVLRWQRDRRGRDPARHRPCARRQAAGSRPRHRLFLRRGRGGGRRVPRIGQPGRPLGSPGAVRLREQPLRDGHGARPLRVRDRHRVEGRRLPASLVVGQRDGCARGRARGERGGSDGARRRRTRLLGSTDLPVPRALDVRPRAIPDQGRGRGMEASRPDPGADRDAQAAGRAGRRGARRARGRDRG